jgi:hypothetical protein
MISHNLGVEWWFPETTGVDRESMMDGYYIVVWYKQEIMVGDYMVGLL